MRKVVSAAKFILLQQKEQRLELAKNVCSHPRLFSEPVLPIPFWIWIVIGLITKEYCR